MAMEKPGLAEATTSGGLTLAALTEIWQRLLGRSPIGPDEDFFDLGGDSLLALRLILEIERIAPCKLPPTLLYETPTLRDLAGYLALTIPKEMSVAVLLKPGDAGRPPLFIAPGLDGTVAEISKLARHMTYAGPIHGFQSSGIDGASPPLDTVEALADRARAALEHLQPQGPCLVAGYSFGGMVALELACRLVAAGREVALLAVIDGYPIRAHWPLFSRLEVMRHRLGYRLGKALRLLAGALVPGGPAGKPAPGEDRRRSHGRFLPDPDLPEAVRRVFLVSDQALARYRPSRFPGPVAFISPRTPGLLPRNPKPVWTRLSAGLTVDRVAGDHRSIFDTGLDELARTLSRRTTDAARTAVMAEAARTAAVPDLAPPRSRDRN